MLPLYDENRSRTRPYVTWVFIIINVVAFALQLYRGFTDADFFQYGAIPYDIVNGRPEIASIALRELGQPTELGFPWPWITLFTSMFMHGGFMHIIGNMLYLYIFGDNVEDRFGHLKYLVLYLIFGLAGGLLHIWMSAQSGVDEMVIPTIGASGAISGLLGAYILLFPNARVVTLIIYGYFSRITRVRALFFIGFWFVLQFLYQLVDPYGGVAYWAHIGGFAAGFIAAIPVRAFGKRPSRRPQRQEWTYSRPI